MNSDPESTRDLDDDSVELSEAASQSSTGGDGAELERQLENLKNELASSKEQILRTQAEAQNVRRRAQQDVERAHKYALEKFVGDLLPVADNLERALTASRDQAGDFAAVAEGVELTLKSLLDTLARHSVETVNPAGEPFNPEFHQAMAAVPNADVEPNTVLEVFQPGYTLNGRLVRPALVVVSKTPGSS